MSVRSARPCFRSARLQKDPATSPASVALETASTHKPTAVPAANQVITVAPATTISAPMAERMKRVWGKARGDTGDARNPNSVVTGSQGDGEDLGNLRS
jgi:hypothetical protein